MADLISFKYTPKGQGPHTINLTSGPTYSSRETRGVWVFGNWAWKIFPNITQWDRIDKVYKAAKASGLPVPSCELHRGTITDSRKRTKEGFALVMAHITHPARFFALKNGNGTLEQYIAPITDDKILSKIEDAFSAAMKIGLKDPQGFINQYDPKQPIVFIDLHTSSPAAMSLRDMHKHVRAKRATLRQQGGR